MSVLEFISSLKWPTVILAIFGAITRALKRSPTAARAFALWINRANISMNFAGLQLDLTQSGAAVAATAPDAQLAEATTPGADATAIERAPRLGPRSGTVSIRREAINQLLQDAARLGWEAGLRGNPDTPRITVEWASAATADNEGQQRIRDWLTASNIPHQPWPPESWFRDDPGSSEMPLGRR